MTGARRRFFGSVLQIAVGALFEVPAAAQGLPSDAPHYIGSDACIACHEDQGEAWRGSHHALAWSEPGPETALGKFDGAVFEHQGVTHRFFRDGDEYMIETDGPDGAITTYPVVGVAGIEPLQQYLLETEPGREQAHDVAWDVERGAWFHLYPEQRLKAGDGLHWTGPYKTWNARCAECHATGYEKRYEPAERRYDSRQAEIGVGCEACHGPGSHHRDWAERGAPEDRDPGLTSVFPEDDAEAQIQQCAGCHSRREPFGDVSPAPGASFHDAYRLALLRPGLYHPDGAIRDEVYVYGSFLQSKMYAKGVRCTDCHDPHRAKLKAEGNAICAQCHSPAGDARFPSLSKSLYDGSSHHFHPAGSDGAACVNCHMVERTYMQVDPRRDHSFRIPRPDLSAETGAPNACTDCHADRDAAWAARELAKRFPHSRRRGPHFSQTFSAARVDAGTNARRLLDIASASELSGIVRATALELLQSAAEPYLVEEAAILLTDDDPLVRAAAVGVQRGADPETRARRLWPLLRDARRNVRLATARALLDVPGRALAQLDLNVLQAAMGEWRTALYAKADFPETHMVLGGAALTMRDFRAADSAFREAVRIDPNQVEGWLMLGRLRAALGDHAGAQAAIREGLDVNPTDFELLELEGALSE